MRIDRIELCHVAMPLIYPWRTAYGEDPDIHSVLIRIVSGEHYAWGETTPLKAPCYSPEWAGGVFAISRDFLAPQLIGKDIESAEALQDCLAIYKGNQFAKAGLENAWWVLNAKIQGKPLHQLLGGESHPISVGADFGIQDSIEILLQKIGAAVAEGYPRVKLKFRKGWDIDMLKAVRDSFPDHVFHIDCNAGLTLDDIDLLQKADRFNLAMIEQPLDPMDLLGHSRLQKVLSTPICLDETVTSPRVMEQAIELGCCRYTNIKPGRVGGLSNALKIHNLCRDAGIPCWVGGMLESAIGSGVALALATLPNFKYPADIFPSRVMYVEDLAEPEVSLSSPGKIVVSETPGMPYQPKRGMLEKCLIERAAIDKS